VRCVIVLAVVLAAVRSGHAQPVSYDVAGAAGAGKRPTITITAAQAVSDVRVELDRSDGKHFAMRQPSLAKGQTVTMQVGDGAVGKATYKGKLSVQIVGGAKWSDDVAFETDSPVALHVAYDADHLDLDKHVLQFKPTRAIASATIVAIGEDGKELGKGAASFNNEGADTWLSISWTQPADARVMMLKLRVDAGGGVASNVELIPWSVSIDHEDVNFATDSAVIEQGETKKLDASLAKIADVVKRAGKFMKMTLYVAGHTDTVGPSDKNRRLSLARALAIAQYFRKHGVAMPIAVAGFGEDVLKVQTRDTTDERANRRADYVIGPAGGAPPFKGPYLKAHADWKALR
jgi:outer membrane protein OmpA-like peptidoglycan-associated protein